MTPAPAILQRTGFRRSRQSSRKTVSEAEKRPFLHLSGRDWLWPLLFMLSASMIGLKIPFGYVGALLVLLNRWKKDRYDFIIQLTLLIGGYSLLIPHQNFFFPIDIPLFFIIVGCFVLYRRRGIMAKIIGLTAIYAAGLLVFAFLSEESLRIQFTGLHNWLMFGYFIIPLLCFSGREFDMNTFFRHLMPYLFIFCIYYLLDGMVFCGSVLLPQDTAAFAWSEAENTFYNLHWAPLSMRFQRIWPQGLYILILCIYPLFYCFRMTWWQWALLLGALFVDRTMSFLLGLFVCVIVVQGKPLKALKYTGICLAVGVVLYFVDTEPVFDESQGYQSTLRVKSTVKQFTDVSDAQFIEDYASLGSTRMAQAIPKMQLLFDLGRQWIGFGWLSPSKTTNQKYIVINEFIAEGLGNDEIDAEEVATQVEIIPIQVILNVGFLGLIFHTLVYIGYWWIVRKYRYSLFFAAVVITFVVIGLGGFSGLVTPAGLYLCGLTYATVILANRREMGGFNLPEAKKKHFTFLQH